MPSLNIVRVLDALERASMEQSKKGQSEEWVQFGVLKNRVSVEYPALNDASVPVLVSRYLKQALTDGYVVGEKRGRNAFYKITANGIAFILERRDQLGRYTVPWREEKTAFGLMSYAVAPVGSPLYIERRGEDSSLQGSKEVDEFMEKMKEKNPGLRSLILRFE